jgi:hypothetical protein
MVVVQLEMHHFSFVRANIARKLENVSNRGNYSGIPLFAVTRFPEVGRNVGVRLQWAALLSSRLLSKRGIHRSRCLSPTHISECVRGLL